MKKFPFWFGIVFFLLVLIGLGCLSYFLSNQNKELKNEIETKNTFISSMLIKEAENSSKRYQSSLFMLSKTSIDALPYVDRVLNVKLPIDALVTKSFGSGMWGYLYESISIKGSDYTFNIFPSSEGVSRILSSAEKSSMRDVVVNKELNREKIEKIKLVDGESSYYLYGTYISLKKGDSCGVTVLKAEALCFLDYVMYFNAKKEHYANIMMTCEGEDKGNICDSIMSSIVPIELNKE